MKKNWLVLSLLLAAALTATDLLYEKHPHVRYEAWFNFYGFAAAAATLALCALGRAVVPLLARKEDYYAG